MTREELRESFEERLNRFMENETEGSLFKYF